MVKPRGALNQYIWKEVDDPTQEEKHSHLHVRMPDTVPLNYQQPHEAPYDQHKRRPRQQVIETRVPQTKIP